MSLKFALRSIGILAAAALLITAVGLKPAAAMGPAGTGGDAVPTARQWIANDYSFKTTAFLTGGIVTMIAGATLAFIGGHRTKCALAMNE